jgi:hypothetical protein
MNSTMAFRAALTLDTAGVLGLCAVALAHPQPRVAAIRAAVSLAGVALAYPALHLVLAEPTDEQLAERARGRASALNASGVLINTIGGVRLINVADGRPLSWLLLLGGNFHSMVYLAAILAGQSQP